MELNRIESLDNFNVDTALFLRSLDRFHRDQATQADHVLLLWIWDVGDVVELFLPRHMISSHCRGSAIYVHIGLFEYFVLEVLEVDFRILLLIELTFFERSSLRRKYCV